jgi:hypothetical protein
MAKLIYASNMSLDGCTEDEHGRFDWAPPDDDVFAFITELMRSAGTYLYGRRMYETMAVWETEPALAAQSDLMGEFANAWQSADKIVYSTTLAAVSTAKTRLEGHGGAFVGVLPAAEPPAERGIVVSVVVTHPDGHRLSELLAGTASGALPARVLSVLPLDEVADAHRAVAKGGVRGRYVLTP